MIPRMGDEPRLPSEDRPHWPLNRDEQRQLGISIVGAFVGGVASIVIGAAIIGGAIAVAKLWGRRGGTVLSIAGGLLACLVFGVLAGLFLWRSRRHLVRSEVIFYWSIIAASSLGASLCLLVLIGDGAGIH